jgi:hypothetical protein
LRWLVIILLVLGAHFAMTVIDVFLLWDVFGWRWTLAGLVGG